MNFQEGERSQVAQFPLQSDNRVLTSAGRHNTIFDKSDILLGSWDPSFG